METTTAAKPVTWLLAEADVPAAIARLARLNDRAARNGLQGGYTWEIGEEIATPVYDDRGDYGDAAEIVWAGESVPRTVLYYRYERELRVTGTAPRLAGWAFLALLTWDCGTLATRCTPGWDGRIDDALLSEGRCDHCRTDRRRKDCYLLENAETGERVQVGSSCIRDFLGHAFRPSMIRYASDLDELGEALRGGDMASPPAVVLAWAASMCDGAGWVSRDRAAQSGRPATGDLLKDALYGTSPAARALRDKFRPGPAHLEEAAAVAEWAGRIDRSRCDEYLANVSRLAGAECVSERNTPVLGSAVSSWRRQQERDARQAAREAARSDSQWVGEEKERLTLDVTVVSAGDVTSADDFGVRYKYVFVTAGGCLLDWWTSRQDGLAAGDAVRLTGTVKRHAEWNGAKSTVLLRCKYQPAG
jgi:hypothetical protein